MRLALEGAFETVVSAPSEQVVVPQLQVWQRPIPLALAFLAVVGLAVWATIRPQPIPPPDVMRFAIVPPDSAPVNLVGNSHDLAISPMASTSSTRRTRDSSSLRPIDQLVGGALQGAEGGGAPFVSADSEWVGFHLNDARTLQKVPIFGGPPVTLTESPNPISVAS